MVDRIQMILMMKTTVSKNCMSQLNNFLKLYCKISQLYVTLMNNFDKTIVFVLYNSVLEINEL